MFFPIDYGVLERHIHVDSILGALDMEKDSFQTAQLFSWIFFTIWIILAIVQTICFLLSNGKFHPLAKILEGCDVNRMGMLMCCTMKNESIGCCLLNFT